MALVDGFTKFDKATGGSTPSGVIIVDSAGAEYYLWPDTAGKLRVAAKATAEAGGFNWNSGGTVVGAQTA